MKWSEVKWTKQSEVEWGEVKCSIGKGRERVFLEKVYRSSKWWEVKGWGESVSELMIEKKNHYKKLYAVLSYLGVFTFCTCCILTCLVCIVASFKLSCVCVLFSYVYLLYYVGIAIFYFRCGTAG